MISHDREASPHIGTEDSSRVIRRSNRIILALAVTLLIAALVVGAAALRRANDLLEALPSLAGGCGEDLHASALSPDKKYVVAVFLRNCGATTPIVTHVNLRETSHPFSSTLHGTIDEGEVFVRRGEGSVKLVWKDASHLVIECPPTDVFELNPETEVYEQEASWRDVTINYRPLHE
jgi:hypothetical protein